MAKEMSNTWAATMTSEMAVTEKHIADKAKNGVA